MLLQMDVLQAVYKRIHQRASLHTLQALTSLLLIAVILISGNGQAILYCKDGDVYRAVGNSWMKGCIKYQCTQYGIEVSNQTYPPCRFLKTREEVRQECSSVIVQGDDGCCQGLECPKPEVQPVGASNCSPGWIELTTTRSQLGSYSVCLKYSESKQAYEAAAQDCRRQMASLIDPRATPRKSRVLLSLMEHFKNAGIRYFWSGLHSRDGYFYWDEFLSVVDAEYFDACRSNNGSDGVNFGWDCGQPSRKGECAKAMFRNDTFVYESVNCEQQLHYACFKYAESWHGIHYITGTKSCPIGWLFSLEAKKCYKFYDERVNAFEAMASCQRDKAMMTSAVNATQAGVIMNTIPVGSRTAPKEIHAGVCSSKTLQQCAHLPTRLSNGTIERFCAKLNNYRLPWRTNQLINFSSCYNQLPYVCEMSASGPTVGGLYVAAEPNALASCRADFGAIPNISRSYVSWIRDGRFSQLQVAQIQVDRQAAYTCYTTELSSGERIYSPTLVIGKELNDIEDLVFSTRMNSSPAFAKTCMGYNPGDVPSYLLKLALEIFYISKITDTFQIEWISTLLTPVTCRASAGNEIVLVVGARYRKNVRMQPTMRREAAAIGRAPLKLAVDKLPNVDELSNLLERELRKGWSSEMKKHSFWLNWNATVQADTINVRSLRFCNQKTVNTKELGNITIQRTSVDTWFNLSLCISTRRPLLAMYCQANFITGATWTTVIENECTDVISTSESALKLLSSKQMDESTVTKILSSALHMANNSNAGFGMTTSEIMDVASLVKSALALFSDNRTMNYHVVQKMTMLIPALVSQVMRTSKEHIGEAEELANSSTLLTKALEDLSDKMLDMLDDASENHTISRIEDNVAIKVTRDPLMVGLGLLSTGAIEERKLIEIRSDNNEIANKLAALLTVSSGAVDNKKSFIVYNDNKLFKGRLKTAATDVVLSASLKTNSDDVEPSDIRTTFINTMGVEPDALECGFWSYGKNDWSTEGCRKIGFTVETTTCSCNHTTSFAVILSSKPSSANDIHSIVFTLVTKIGLSISISSLLVVMVTFIIFKRMRQALSQKVLFNLSLALLLLYVTFLVGIERTENTVACTIVAILQHYFLLSSFAWMAVEAILQYFRFVKVIGSYVPRFIIKAAVPAWGAPALIVGIASITDYRLYLRTDGVCWVRETLLYYGVILPIAIVISFNSFVFALVLRSLLCRKNAALRSNQSEMQMMRLHAKAAIAVSVVMGLTWTFGFLVVQQSGVFGIICEYLFCVLNSIQGLLILCFHCAREKTVIDAWKNLLGWRKQVSRMDDASMVVTSHESRALTSVENLSTDANFDALEDKK